MNEHHLGTLLTEEWIITEAGPRSFARGATYRDDGRVESVVASGDRVQAIVRGSMPYRVELWTAAGGVEWSCTCPVGDDGDFCKHAVAVALTIARSNDGDRCSKRPSRSDDREIDVGTYVQSLDRDELVDLALGQIDRDWRLREQLAARAAFARGHGVDVPAWRRRLGSAFDADDGFVPYREVAGWASGIDETLGALDDLTESGHADAVIILAEHAHGLADASMQYVEDSDGWLSEISGRIGEIHLRACERGDPDRVELARRLVSVELTSELDAFHRAAYTYKDVLGAAGLTEYRKVVEPKWLRLGPDSDRWSSERFRVREAMIGVALASGDPEELIRVKEHDLRTPDDYGEIARSLQGAGEVDGAITWARKGLDTFIDRPWQTPPLRELLAEMLRARGDVEGSIEMFWLAFDAQPSVEAYRRLLVEADLADRHELLAERARTALRRRVADRRPIDDSTRSIATASPVTALIEILLYEGDLGGAWAAAVTYGCSERLWLTLARAREVDHPADAIPIYEREVFAQIDTKKNPGYRKAVDLLTRIRTLAERAGEPERFAHLLADVRATHKAKRNLIALLDRKPWSNGGAARLRNGG